jgi:hypothetical protein
MFLTHSNHSPSQQVPNKTEISKKNETTERFLVSLLAEMRLKVKEGTQSTLVKMNEAEI